MDNPLQIGAALGLLAGIPIILAAMAASRGRRRKFAEICPGSAFRLRYCSEMGFRTLWKFFPWEGIGFLTFDGGDVTFEGHPNQGAVFRVQVPVADLERYGWRSWFRNGLMPWLLLKHGQGNLYLCAETGAFIFGAETKTGELLSSIPTQNTL